MKRIIFVRAISLLAITVIILTGCGDTTMKPTQLLLQTDSVSERNLQQLSEKSIYFGHMSVGYNIIDGIKDLMNKNPRIKLNIQESSNITGFKKGIFAHSQNGENGNPKSKIDAFVKTMENGMGKQSNIAFFKFCYVDFNENTDVNDIFIYYKNTMNGLTKKYPNTIVLHATVPLTTEGELLGTKEKVKDIIKKIIGRATRAELNQLSNIKRNEFNALLIKEFGKGSIIDIAAYEATGADGKQYISKNNGTLHLSMVPAYSFDGGHLNEAGRITVADKFLALLAGIR